MIRRVVRLRRGLLYAHLHHDLSTAWRDSGAARRRPLPRAMPRNAATAAAAVPCRAPLRLKRLSLHDPSCRSRSQVGGGAPSASPPQPGPDLYSPYCRVNTTIQFNTLGSNVDCSGTLHGMFDSRPAPPPRRMAVGSRGAPMLSRYECHRQPALARSSGLVLKLGRRSKHSASDTRPYRNSSASNNAALAYASAQVTDNLPAKRRGKHRHSP